MDTGGEGSVTSPQCCPDSERVGAAGPWSIYSASMPVRKSARAWPGLGCSRRVRCAMGEEVNMADTSTIVANVKLGVGLALATLVILFTVQNVKAVPVNLLFWSFPLSVSLLIFGSLATGMIAGWLAANWLHYKKSRAMKT